MYNSVMTDLEFRTDAVGVVHESVSIDWQCAMLVKPIPFGEYRRHEEYERGLVQERFFVDGKEMPKEEFDLLFPHIAKMNTESL